MTAREEILRRIGVALSDQPTPTPVARDYRTAGDVVVGRDELLDQFVERLTDYRATVHRSSADGVWAELTVILAGRGIARVVVPDGFPEAWLPNVAVVRDPVSTDDLDSIGAVLTSCAVAVAETGTVILDTGAGQGRRALTLVPDYHLVVVRAEQVMAIVPEAIAALDPTKPLTWISGPSATSDIELNRVEGVHGPRTLDVLLVSASEVPPARYVIPAQPPPRLVMSAQVSFATARRQPCAPSVLDFFRDDPDVAAAGISATQVHARLVAQGLPHSRNAVYLCMRHLAEGGQLVWANRRFYGPQPDKAP